MDDQKPIFFHSLALQLLTTMAIGAARFHPPSFCGAFTAKQPMLHKESLGENRPRSGNPLAVTKPTDLNQFTTRVLLDH
jgi:hypothetical protein